MGIYCRANPSRSGGLSPRAPPEKQDPRDDSKGLTCLVPLVNISEGRHKYRAASVKAGAASRQPEIWPPGSVLFDLWVLFLRNWLSCWRCGLLHRASGFLASLKVRRYSVGAEYGCPLRGASALCFVSDSKCQFILLCYLPGCYRNLSFMLLMKRFWNFGFHKTRKQVLLCQNLGFSSASFVCPVSPPFLFICIYWMTFLHQAQELLAVKVTLSSSSSSLAGISEHFLSARTASYLTVSQALLLSSFYRCDTGIW